MEIKDVLANMKEYSELFEIIMYLFTIISTCVLAINIILVLIFAIIANVKHINGFVKKKETDVSRFSIYCLISSLVTCVMFFFAVLIESGVSFIS